MQHVKPKAVPLVDVSAMVNQRLNGVDISFESCEVHGAELVAICDCINPSLSLLVHLLLVLASSPLFEKVQKHSNFARH